MNALVYLAAAGTMPPLTDPLGEPYPHESMPCTQQPELWDAASDWPARARAMEACGGCPALGACAARLAQLDGLVAGVWAGRDIPEPTEVPAVYDAAVAAWITRAGVTLRTPPPPSPTRRRRKRASA